MKRQAVTFSIRSARGIVSCGVLMALCLVACDRRAKPQNPGATSTSAPTSAPAPSSGTQRFGVIGDFGIAGDDEARVADLVNGQAPEFLITTGDNNYPAGAADTIDPNIGQYFHAFIAPYRGAFGAGSKTNLFFPSLGNHDWMTPGAKPYLDYFELPGNERYYDVVQGNVHLFSIDSDPSEPDGIDANSTQAQWLKRRLASSTAAWKVVYFHHPPYSSGAHGSSPTLRWPFREWGASIVYSGHDHTYERFDIAGFPYVVNGVGGKDLYQLGPRLAGSVTGFDDVHGAVFVATTPTEFVSRFLASDGRMLDELRLKRP